MFSRLSFFLVMLCFLATNVKADVRVATAHFVSVNVTGTLLFTETDQGLRVTGTLTGLAAGNYGFHVHELGDISTCLTTGAHFDLNGNNHGGREHEVRHTGDLGNIVFVETRNGVATIDFVDEVIALRGENSILGRAIVVHELPDDLGQGGDETSLITGNAGDRLACAVIGIRSPATPWNNSAIKATSSVVLFLALAFNLFYLS